MKVFHEEAFSEKILFPNENFKILVHDKHPETEERAFHEEIEVKYFYEGQCNLMINSEMIVAQAGDIAIVNPYQVHSNVNIDQYNGKYGSFIIGLDFFMGFTNELDLRNILINGGNSFCNHIQGDKRLQTILLRVIEEMREREENYCLIVRNLMCEFFALLLRGYLIKNKTRGEILPERKRMEIISPALSKIFTEYNKKLTVEYLASLCNVSPCHFCRVFKSAMQSTVTQYIMAYRVQIAETMLRTTDKNVGEIAWLCGFQDVSYFYRCYKKIKGVSLKIVRKNEEE